MLIDIHTHILNRNFDIKKCKLNLTTKIFFLGHRISNFNDYYNKVVKSLKESRVEKAVVCAINGTLFCSDNIQTAQICKENPNFLYGVNLNPLSPDFKNEIQQAISNNAVLVKILPSFQNVDLSCENCIPFFEMLKEYKLPLLVHTGIEHSLLGGNQKLNSPKKLELALKCGVKVIAAHCGAKLNLWEKDYFDIWEKMAKEYENFYGDLSAMIYFYRHKYIKKILKDETLKLKILFGTDFPAFPNTASFLRSKNVFDDWLFMFENLGFTEDVFTRAESILRLNVNSNIAIEKEGALS